MAQEKEEKSEIQKYSQRDGPEEKAPCEDFIFMVTNGQRPLPQRYPKEGDDIRELFLKKYKGIH